MTVILCRVAETVVRICAKALKLTVSSPDLCGLSDFRVEDVEAVRLDAERDSLTPPIARVDLTFDGVNVNVLEINSDSPAGSFHLDLIRRPQATWASQFGVNSIAKGSTRVSDTVIEVLLTKWKQFAARTGRDESSLPTVAIVDADWEEQPARPEFEYYQSLLKKRGLAATICNPEDLRARDHGLFVDDQRIDLIYKRVLWKDLAQSHDEKLQRVEADIMQCYRRDAVCVVNPLGSRLVGSKYLFAVMCDPEFEQRLQACNIELTDEEQDVIRNNVPWTRNWQNASDELQDRVFGNLDQYVVKSYAGFGGEEVELGNLIDRPKGTFRSRIAGENIVQEIVRHGSVTVPIVKQGDVYWERLSMILGAYVIDGECVGIEAKVSESLPISIRQGALRTAVLALSDMS